MSGNRQRRRRAATRVPRANRRRSEFIRKLWCNKTIEINNSVNMYDYGMAHINFSLTDFFGGQALSQGFDSFRISRCKAFASLGKNTTLHDVNTIELFTAVDYDGLYTGAGRGAVLSSNLCRKHTFRPDDSPMIANFVPRTLINDRQISNQPVNTGAWGTSWKGFNILALDFAANGSPTNRKTLVITLEVDVTLTRPNPSSIVAANGILPPNGLATVSIDNPEAPDSDLGGDIPYLKNALLTGAYFPVDMLGHNIGNMGSNDDDYTGAKFRDQSNNQYYEVNNWDLVNQVWTSIEYTP